MTSKMTFEPTIIGNIEVKTKIFRSSTFEG